MHFVIFVAPFFSDHAVRFIEAIARLPDIQLGILSMEPFDRFPRHLLGGIAAYKTTSDVVSTGAIDSGSAAVEIEQGARDLQRYVKSGSIHRLFGAVEQIQVPLAQAREKLGIEGMRTETALNFRDKHRMKSILEKAGVPCAKHRTAQSVEEIWKAAEALGFPLVVKPPAGAGAASTFRVNDAAELKKRLPEVTVGPNDLVLIEELVQGNEHSFETISIDGKHIWHSLTHYYPTPLEVLRNPWIQWSVVLPREVDDPKYDDIRAAARQTLDVLGMGTGLSHMEWFRRHDGSIAVSEVGARPPGAQFTQLVGFAHEIDCCYAWARVMVFGDFEPPRRKFAAGIAYLRGQGTGPIRTITGIDKVESEIGHLIVGSKLPVVGHARNTGYEGDGYMIVRHEKTSVVERALQKIISMVHVDCG
ncbi:MAG TPA: ATP-grasp domain-containing protein [Polyangium sp.]|nr:ATP-grasp domain-containing protein [Polyangium sp.]